MFNVATSCVHVEQPPLGPEQGGSKLEQKTENICMLCFVCSQLRAGQGECITMTWIKHEVSARCQMLHKK